VTAPATRWAGPLAALLLAACQPQARRLLLLDLTLVDPVVLNGTARPWHDAGYTVEYRRFYPHLTRQDLERYRTVMLLGGREPEGASDALTVGDLAVLHEWVLRGGVVVLGYGGDGEGYLDRWLLNRWLELEGAGIVIGDRLLEDTTARPSPHPPEAWVESRRMGDEPLGSVFDPFPLERNHVVSVRDQAELLATAGRHAFVRAPKAPSPRPDAGVAAAARIGDGLVVVISRHALGALGPQSRAPAAPVLQSGAGGAARDFLTALARWTRRPAEWAHVPPAGHGAPLLVGDAPAPVEWQPPPLAPPADAGQTPLPLEPDPTLARAAGTPVWVRQQGIRALWAPLFALREGRRAPRSTAALDSLVGFLDVGAVNLLAGDAEPRAVADSAHVPWEARDTRRAWADLATRLQPTSVAWIPALDYRDGRVPIADSSRGPRGEAVADWCALDSLFWSELVAPAFGALSRLAAEQRELVLAAGLDLRDDVHSATGEFCDAAWYHTLARLGRDGSLDSLPPEQRYRTLREQGLLAAYHRALEDEVAARAAALRDRALRLRSNLLFAFRLGRTPSDWFSLGLLRGFALPDRPVLLFGRDVRTHELLALYRARGINAVHAVELAPALMGARD